MNYKATLVVYSLLLNFHCYCNYSIIQVNDADVLIHACLQKVMTLLFGADETVAFIFEKETNIILPSEIKNPRTIAIISKLSEMALTYYYNYVIVSKEFNSLKQTTEELIRSPLWEKSNSPRGRFLVLLFSEDRLNETIKYFWQLDITNLVLVTNGISDNPIKVYKSDSFYQKGRCLDFLKAKRIDPCNSITNATFPKITTLSGCHIRLVDSQNISGVLQQRGRAFANTIKLLVLMADFLKANITFQQTQNITEAVYNRSDDIMLYYFYSRFEALYKNYDVTNFFLTDGVVWVVPKSAKLSGYKILNSLFKATFWMALLIAFLVTVLFMWFSAKCVPNQTKFESLQRCLLITLMFSFESSANIAPNNTALRILVIFYLVYSMQLSSVFHGKLISALTEPGHEPPITTMEEFADLKLPVVVSSVAYKMASQNDRGPIDEKIYKRMIRVDPHIMLETIMGIAYDRNITSYCTGSLIRKVLPELKSMIDVVENTSALPSESVVIMRKGHHLYHVFNDVISKITEFGFQERIISNFIEDRPVKREEGVESNVVLTLAHLHTVFLLWVFGLIISTFGFVLERMKRAL